MPTTHYPHLQAYNGASGGNFNEISDSFIFIVQLNKYVEHEY